MISHVIAGIALGTFSAAFAGISGSSWLVVLLAYSGGGILAMTVSIMLLLLFWQSAHANQVDHNPATAD